MPHPFQIIFLAVFLNANLLFAEDLPVCQGNNPNIWDQCIGTLNYADGGKLVSKFRNGSSEGIAQMELRNPYTSLTDTYEGEQVGGIIHGKGKYRYGDGTIYEGEFFNGKIEGFGELLYVSGEKYRGHFTNNRHDGEGTIFFTNGISWSGKWRANTPENPGIATLSNGESYPALLDQTRGLITLLDEFGEELKDREPLSIYNKPNLTPNERVANELFTQEIIELLNNGKGITAKQKVIDHYESSKVMSSEFADGALTDLLDLCLLMGDNDCFVTHYDKYPELLKVDGDKRRPKEGKAEIEIWRRDMDNAISKLLYRNWLSVSETPLADITSWNLNGFFGSNVGVYATFLSAIEARALLLLGKRESAQNAQYRARILATNSDLRMLNTQNFLLFTLENDLLYFRDYRQIRNFYRHCQLRENTKSQTTVNLGLSGCANSEFLNPYFLVRLLYLFYESGSLPEHEEVNVIKTLHTFFQHLEIPRNSIISEYRETFYASLAFAQASGDEKLVDFIPLDESTKWGGNRNSLDRIVLLSYLQITDKNNDKRSIEELDSTIDNIEKVFSRTGQKHNESVAPRLNFLKSLKFRKTSARSEEILYLHEYIKAYKKSLGNLNLSIIDTAPSIPRFESQIARYVIQRLLEIEGKSDELLDYVLIVSQLLSSVNDTGASTAYALVNSISGDADKDSVQDRLTLEKRAERFFANRYAFLSLNRSGSSAATLTEINKEEIFSSQLSSGDTVNDWFAKSNLRLRDKRSQSHPIMTIDSSSVKALLGDNETAVYFAESSDIFLCTILSKRGWTVRVVSKSNFSREQRDALSQLRSSNLLEFTIDELRSSSLSISRLLLGAKPELGEHISFVNGPTLLDIPYTLLSSPSTTSWLINEHVPRSFKGLQHLEASRKTRLSSLPNLTYVAFANPLLQNPDIANQVAKLEQTIRGVGTGIYKLSELPETEVEAKIIGSNLAGEHKYFFGVDANINNLMSIDYDNVEILSFNTHGVMAGEIDGALTSSIVLSETEENNGIVPADWLFYLKGAPRTALLLTCNSGIASDTVTRSDIESLADSFLLKGTNAVISSFWQVNSDATVSISSVLSKRLGGGDELGNALNYASRSLLNDPDWRHPAYWAAFVVAGEYRRDIKTQTTGPISAETNEVIKGAVYDPTFDGLKTIFQTTTEEGFSTHTVWPQADRIEVSSTNPTWQIPHALFSSNTGNGVFEANAEGRLFEISAIDLNGKRRSVCRIEYEYMFSSVHIPKDFLVLNNTIYIEILLNNGNEKQAKILSYSKDNCQKLSEYERALKRGEAVRMFPGAGSDKLILTFWSETSKPNVYPHKSKRSNLGTFITCSDKYETDYFVMDMNLSIINENQLRNIVFLPSPKAQETGINLIYYSPCYFIQEARIAQPSEFEKENLQVDNLGLAPSSDLSDLIQKTINESFKNLFWYSYFLVDSQIVIYVYGLTGTEYSEDLSGKNGITRDVQNARQRLLGGIYSTTLSNTGIWKKLTNFSECDYSAFPVVHSPTIVLACTEVSDRQPKEKILRLINFGKQAGFR